jgi:hypothetical protein
VDENGWLTAAGIVVNLENALSGLTGPSTRLAASMPVESTNPVPLILAAQRCILDNLEAWTVCSFDSSVGVETSAEGSASLRRRRDAFIAEKKHHALTLLQKAAHMHADPRWKELRVDYRQKDLDAMQDAKLKLNALKRVSAERTLPSVRPRTPRRWQADFAKRLSSVRERLSYKTPRLLSYPVPSPRVLKGYENCRSDVNCKWATVDARMAQSQTALTVMRDKLGDKLKTSLCRSALRSHLRNCSSSNPRNRGVGHLEQRVQQATANFGGLTFAFGNNFDVKMFFENYEQDTWMQRRLYNT